MKQLYASVLKSHLNTEGAGNSLYSRHVQKIILAQHCAVFPTQISITLEDSSCAPRFPASCVVTSPCNAEYQEAPTPCPTANSSCLAGWLRSNHRNHLGHRNPTATVESFCGFNEDDDFSILVSGEQPQQTQLVQFVTQKTLAPDLSKFVVKGGVSFLVLSHHPLEYEGTESFTDLWSSQQQTLTSRILSELFQDTWDPDSHEHFYCSDRNRAPGIHCHCPPSDLHTYT